MSGSNNSVLRFVLLWVSFLSLHICNVDAQSSELKWLKWDEAMRLNKENPKKILVDLFTDWCGWCKKMDATSFKNKNVIEYINQNYYAVKFDAEQKDTIYYDNQMFVLRPGGRRGVHELAEAIMEGQMSYPCIVYFNSGMERILISQGYKSAEGLLKELKFVQEDIYVHVRWEDYQKN